MGAAGKRIVIMLFEGVDLLDVTGPPEVFALLRREVPDADRYQVLLAAPTLEPVRTAAGVRVVPDVTIHQVAERCIDTLLVPGSVRIDDDGRVHAVIDPDVVAAVRGLAARSRRIASVCVGAHLLAAAGLLDGKRATTHWSTASQLAADFPAVRVDPDPIFIRDGHVWTGAGLTACLDLSLALVVEDFGEAVALAVSRQLVMYLKRTGGQSQFSVPTRPVTTTRRMDELRRYILDNLASPLTLEVLARQASVGPRQLTRIFKAEVDTTPASYVEDLRVEAARNRLEATDDTLDRVAAACGFSSTDTLIRAFRRKLDATPTEYRQRFRRTA